MATHIKGIKTLWRTLTKIILKQKYFPEPVSYTHLSGLTVEEAASNVLVTMESEGFSNVEVYKGLTRPMVGTRCTRKLNTHKLIGTRLEKTPNKKSAVDVMIELAEKGNVEIITMGPLTNVALAFAKNRKAMLNVKKITMLAGMVFHGDVGPLSEYNFYMAVSYTHLDVYKRQEYVRCVTKEELLATSDVITVHIPGTKENQKFLSREEFKQMKKTAYLIHVSRGGVVDETALAEAVKEGRIGGAAVDVFAKEPPDIKGKIFQTPGIFAVSYTHLDVYKRQV